MFRKILEFLFGKNPDVFDKNGAVLHKHPEKKWKLWHTKYSAEQNNWRHHSGTHPKVNKPS